MKWKALFTDAIMNWFLTQLIPRSGIFGSCVSIVCKSLVQFKAQLKLLLIECDLVFLVMLVTWNCSISSWSHCVHFAMITLLHLDLHLAGVNRGRPLVGYNFQYRFFIRF